MKKAYVRQSFTADSEVIDFLENFKEKYKIPKSIIIRDLIKFYKNKPKKLLQILTGNEK